MPDPSPLTAAQLTRLRKEWVLDLADLHQEFGASPVVSGSTVIGSATLALSGLASGTIAKGTRLQLNSASAGAWRTYVVTADVTISGNAATLAIAPPIAIAAVAGDVVMPDPVFTSTYNKRTRRAYFEDIALQSLAARALEQRGKEIYAAPDRDEAWFRVIRVMAFEILLADSGWRDIVRSDDTNNRAQDFFDSMQHVLDVDKEAAAPARTRISITR